MEIRPTVQPTKRTRAAFARRLLAGLPVWMSVIHTTTDNTSKVLSGKEQARLQPVRQTLMSNGNPYESVNTLVGSNNLDRKVSVKKELTDDERREKFNSVVGSHKWQFIDSDATEAVSNDKLLGPVCISCHKAVNTITSVYGRVIVQMLRKALHLLKVLPETGLTEVIKVVGIPVYSTGYCCQSCFDTLYAAKYTDWQGNVKRSIELLEPPKLTVKEAYSSGNGREKIHTVPAIPLLRPSKDDSLPRGKDKVKRVSTISLGKGGQVLEADDEEWIIGGLPKQSHRDEVPDPAGFYRFTKTGRRKVG